RRHTRSTRDWSSDVCSSDLVAFSNNLSPKCRLRHFSEKAVAAVVWAGAAEAPNSVTKRHHRSGGGVRYPPIGAATLSSAQPPLRSEERRVGKEGAAEDMAGR